ncbi:MAG TPA: hypothetical protein DCE55_24910 [Planctomycetaceae bacterium]|nr:hypothetical protein [Planctomycetaceae bacterium]
MTPSGPQARYGCRPKWPSLQTQHPRRTGWRLKMKVRDGWTTRVRTLLSHDQCRPLTAAVLWLIVSLFDSGTSRSETAGETATEAAQPPPSAARLVGHWPLAEDTRDVVGTLPGKPTNVTFGRTAGSAKAAAIFNGRDSVITIPAGAALQLGTRDFSLTAWVKCDVPLRNTLGDLVSQFDPAARRGFNLHLSGSSPAYSSMSDTRHVHFGIDDGYLGPAEDCGKPWPSNSLITCLIVFDGELYCGIADADRTEDKARVFRYAGGKRWIDCGRLGNDPNHHSVQAMVVHDGKLYAGTGIYDWVQAMDQLPGKPPAAPTRVFVYAGGTSWRDLGQVGFGSRVLCMGSFQGELFAGMDVIGKGHAYKFDGTKWIDCGAPDGRNFECFLPFGGKLYAATHGNVFEYEGGTSWRSIGAEPHGITQIHSMQVAGGRMLLGTWPQGYVLRYDGENKWTKLGRVGLPPGPQQCNEINDLTVYNGKLYAGVIPKAELYRYEKEGEWTLLGSLANRSDWAADNLATWLRLTCLTTFQGRLFAATGACQGRALDAPVDPSMGRVFAYQAGQVVSSEHDIGGAWTHIAAVRQGRTLKLYVNGTRVTTSQLRAGPLFNLTNDRPLLVGFGAQHYFSGAIADLRLYHGALGTDAVREVLGQR